jgi:hypothetical protein
MLSLMSNNDVHNEVSITPRMLSRPELLGRPFSRAVVECVPEPPSLGRVAQVRLFHSIGHNNDKPEVFARDSVVQVVCFGAELEVLVVVGLFHGLAGWWVLERACFLLEFEVRK